MQGLDGGHSMKKIVLVFCVLFGLAILWMSRYTIIGIGQNPPCAYKLDRFSGKITILIFDREQSIYDKTHIQRTD